MEEHLNNNEIDNQVTNNEKNKNNQIPNDNEPKKKNWKNIVLIFIIVLLVVGVGLLSYKVFVLDKEKGNKTNNNKVQEKEENKEEKSDKKANYEIKNENGLKYLWINGKKLDDIRTRGTINIIEFKDILIVDVGYKDVLLDGSGETIELEPPIIDDILNENERTGKYYVKDDNLYASYKRYIAYGNNYWFCDVDNDKQNVIVSYDAKYKYLDDKQKFVFDEMINEKTLAETYKEELKKCGKNEVEETKVVTHNKVEYKDSYKMLGNTLEDFDLYFLKSEIGSKNIMYSPMSIKYALSMLKEGTDGDSKAQIESVVGNYVSKKYTNSKNISLANALFVNNTSKKSIKSTYVDAIKSKYNAEVIYDDFKDATNINKWVSEKTFKLIPNLVDEVNNDKLILTNALTIDMEWVKVIQPVNYAYSVGYSHEHYGFKISPIKFYGYTPLKFENLKNEVKAVDIGAVINKYDIVKILGEYNIRKTVGAAYEKWLKEEASSEELEWYKKDYPTTKDYLDKYIKEINSNYKQISSSTDFYFYVDKDVKVFAKDLKKYDGTTLQYVGIMPVNDKLSNFVKNTDSNKINSYINNLKDIKLDSFEEGTVTEISGSIPTFEFRYDLDLIYDLKSIGITDVFDENKADLSKITSEKGMYIVDAAHKASISFTNEGIKAAAATNYGMAGATGGGFDYFYEVPVKKIDLTFDKPYMFIIRDKDTGEVWFTGSVYNPTAISCRDVNGDFNDWYEDNCIINKE